jgi:hypothetical protein
LKYLAKDSHPQVSKAAQLSLERLYSLQWSAQTCDPAVSVGSKVCKRVTSEDSDQ